MDWIQTLNAQLAMMMFFALMPMLGMMQARRAQRGKIKFFIPKNDNTGARRDDEDRIGRKF